MSGPSAFLEQLRDGLLNATSGHPPELDAAHEQARADLSDNPALFAWEQVVDGAANEILPEIARMLTAAIQKRLPWTWQPDVSAAAAMTVSLSRGTVPGPRSALARGA